jgi:hypothetical protein
LISYSAWDLCEILLYYGQKSKFMIERISQVLNGAARNAAFSLPNGLPGPVSKLGLIGLGAIGSRSLSSLLPMPASARESAAYSVRQDPVVLAQMPPQAAIAAGPTQPQVRELALLSADVFRDVATPPAGYRVATDSDLGKLGLKPSDLTSTQSAFRARVYVKNVGADAQYVVAFRGSTSNSDWRSNFQQGLGISSDHYRKALAIGSKLALASNANVTLTGHSLGGGLASATAIAAGRNATTFNSAGLSDATIKQARTIHDAAGVGTKDNVTAYYVRGEILSAIQDGGDRVIGGLLGGLLGVGLADAPEAYGRRIGLDAARPEGVRWYQDNPAARHGMNWVLQSLNGR